MNRTMFVACEAGRDLDSLTQGQPMTKSDLIEAVASRTTITRSRAEAVVNCVFDAMADALVNGEGIEVRGFGSFTVRQYKPYDGRNPRTGEAVHVASKRLPFFKAGKELKERVDGGGTSGDAT
jgi:integration host factor subunit beta